MLEWIFSELPIYLNSIRWIYDNIDIVERSLERAEIVLISLEENTCENCNFKNHYVEYYCECIDCNEKLFCTKRCLDSRNN
jgi:hypothetical protein